MKLKKLLFGLILLFFFACKKDENLDNNFKNVIIDYQKRYPIPLKKRRINESIYIYSAYFEKNKNDTLLNITRTSGGINNIIFKKSGGFGVYEDSELKPTLLYDNENLASKFILKKFIKIDKKYYKKSDIFDEGFTPIHTYKISNKNIELIKIDTVWKHWD